MGPNGPKQVEVECLLAQIKIGIKKEENVKYSTIAALFFMTVLGAERTAAAQGSPCDGKAPGTYCVGQMIMTCKGPGTGPATATGCGVGVDKDGVGLIGRCVSSGPNDNKATCKMEREKKKP